MRKAKEGELRSSVYENRPAKAKRMKEAKENGQMSFDFSGGQQ